jgi:two-component system, OmpR family, phosphate regulon response regulator PhoB
VPHVFVCDDDLALRDIFQEILTDEGYRVTVRASLCEDVNDAVALAPDLIVLDLVFNGRPQGLEFLQRLKASPATRTIPVLVCTAAADVDEKSHHQLTGWECRSVEKPFDLDELIAAVRDGLDKTGIAV